MYEQQETTSVGYQYDMILLEESDGTNPVYIATESSMTEEIDTLREIEIILMVLIQYSLKIYMEVMIMDFLYMKMEVLH